MPCDLWSRNCGDASTNEALGPSITLLLGVPLADLLFSRFFSLKISHIFHCRLRLARVAKKDPKGWPIAQLILKPGYAII